MSLNVRSNIIIWSASWFEITGQAIVTRRVFENQISINWFAASYGSGGMRSILGWPWAILRTYYALFTGKAKVIYLVCSRSGMGFLRDVPALIASYMGARIVVHVHGSDILDLLSSYRFSRIARVLYSRCEIIVPSEHLVEPLHRLCSSKIHHCENFVPLDPKCDFSIDSRLLGSLVVWNSNIMSSKGFFDVVEAVRLARLTLPQLRLVALGRPLQDTEMSEEAVRSALDQLTHEDWFTYLGPVPSELAVQWTAVADAIVLPSRYHSECQPLAVVQAMCHGRAILLSDTPALRATMGSYPGKLLKKPSTADIADSLIGMLQSDRNADLEEAAVIARKRFSVESFDLHISTILQGDFSSEIPDEDL